MTDTNFQCGFTANVTPEEATDAISNVPAWWARDFEGSSKAVGDTFTVRFGDTFVTFRVTELVAGKRIAWKVTDCHLHWLTDKQEWNGTEVHWDISRNGDATKVNLTHVGLVPEIECYQNCRAGWTFYATDSLYKLLTTGQGAPNQAPARNTAARLKYAR